jgi:hypothetical protein
MLNSGNQFFLYILVLASVHERLHACHIQLVCCELWSIGHEPTVVSDKHVHVPDIRCMNT